MTLNKGYRSLGEDRLKAWLNINTRSVLTYIKRQLECRKGCAYSDY